MSQEYSRSLEIHEYLDQIDDVAIRGFAGLALKDACEILPAINQMLQKDQDIAEIRVVIEAIPNAEAISWLVRINSGLIEHCIKIASNNDLNFDLPCWATPQVIASTSLSWIFAHEWTHVIRSHDDVGSELGNEADISRALEQDADFCAVAAIYRSLQTKFSALATDIDIRKLVIHCVFWLLRSLPSQSGSHAEIELRIVNAIIKLSSLSTNRFEPPDCSAEREETLLISTALADVLISAEKNYQAHTPDVEKKPSLLDKVVQASKDGSAGMPTRTWGRISPVVERLSGTRAVSPAKTTIN
ncbi:hypothetical protein [Pseudomonas monteilii]|uniref:hypothetical protein n=1 Tax=Pseudomonas monteilii TaxID=76759 RepID=UPI003D98D399